ncbi:MAG: peptide deformylase [Leptospiraceae bacterium]|nr:peptide deformylase [Leptospiraceae bacterium]
MAIRKILRIGDPRLREIAAAVPETEIGSKEIRDLVKDMKQTMIAANGVGLAAPQIGVLKRVVVVGIESDNPRYKESKGQELEFQALVNPVITPLKSDTGGMWEGCLSVPEMRGYVERPKKIRMEWYDLQGDKHSEVIEGFQAIVYQHECDHLDGVLYVDRLKDPRLFGFNDELDAAENESA